MRLSIDSRVVKRNFVEVSPPRMVDCQEGFLQLEACLTVLSFGGQGQGSTDSENPENNGSPVQLELVGRQETPLEIEAREHAVRIVAEAELRAQELLAQAQTDLDRLRQEVVETAQAEVYPVAQANGYREGRLAGEAEAKRLTETAHQLLLLAQRAIQEEYDKVDEQLLQLAIKIAERLVRAKMAVEPQHLVGVIQALTLLPQDRQGWRLHVAQEDARWLKENQLPCAWVMDESLNPGDCFLECQEGIFDARLEAQLEKLEHILREELEHGGVEPIDSDGGTN